MLTSAKARLTSVTIRIRDPDRRPNLIICLFASCQPYLNISCKFVQKFFCAKLLTERQRRKNKQRRLCILLGGGNNVNSALLRPYATTITMTTTTINQKLCCSGTFRHGIVKTNYTTCNNLLWPPCVADADIIFVLWFLIVALWNRPDH